MSDIAYTAVLPQGWTRPRGFSHAVVAKGTKSVRIAGQIGREPGQSHIPPGTDAGTQWRVALSNVVTVLKAAGGEPQHLVALRAYVTDIAEFNAAGVSDRRGVGRDARQALPGHDPGPGFGPDRSAGQGRDRGRSDSALSLDAPSRTAEEDRHISRLMLFFAIVYLVEGIGQARVGIIYQPLTHYLKEIGWTALQVTAYFAVLNFPWVIKPVFGLVSDFVPLFGYRRKSYLIIASLCAVGAYAGIARQAEPGEFALAAAAHLLRHGHRQHAVRRAAGGERPELPAQQQHSSASNGCGSTSPSWRARSSAVRWSSACRRSRPCRSPPRIAAVAPIAVVLASLFLLDERKVARKRAARCGAPSKASSRRRRRAKLYLVALFLFLYSFAPGLRHAALLLHDRRAEILAGLYRHSGRDRLGRLDRRRPGPSLASAQDELEGAAASQHRARERCRPPRSCCSRTRSRRRS